MTFDANVGAPGPINDIYPLIDGKIYLGGNFAPPIGGGIRQHLARLNQNGTLDELFTSFPNGEVQTILATSSGKVLIGGTFSMIPIENQPQSNLACFIAGNQREILSSAKKAGGSVFWENFRSFYNGTTQIIETASFAANTSNQAVLIWNELIN
jgi:hypothetical protein